MEGDLQKCAEHLVALLRAAKLTLATAESCTGGMIAAAVTDIPGASAVFRYGWITYCNEAKQEQLGVPAKLIEKYTVVSEAVVAAMAEGALTRAHADLAVSVSGNAGPTAAAGEPKVGTVCIGIASSKTPVRTCTLYRPDLPRNAFRRFVTLHVLHSLVELLESSPEK